MSKKTYINGTESQNKKSATYFKRFAPRVNQKELRQDLAEWFETITCKPSTCFVTTVIQLPGTAGRQILPQEYKSIAQACMEGAYLLAEVIAEHGARNVTSTDFRNDRFFVTTDNGVKITMVIE